MGTAVACGDDSQGQCRIPALADGASYTQVAAGGWRTVLLKSDGTAVACGDDAYKQCRIGALAATYCQFPRTLALQLLLQDDGCACLVNLSGQEVSRTTASAGDSLLGVCDRLLDGTAGIHAVRIVLPSGDLLSAALTPNP